MILQKYTKEYEQIDINKRKTFTQILENNTTMSLLKEIEFKQTGVKVTYWKIAMDSVTLFSSKRYSEQEIPMNMEEPIGIDMMPPIATENPKIHMIIYGYLDEASRRAGKEPIMAKTAAIDCPAEGNWSDERRLLLYTMLKLQDYWKDAEDC